MKASICLIQLTRIGDVLQTYIAARQLKIEYPDIKLTLIARKSMASGLEFLTQSIFDEIFYIDMKLFFDKENNNLKKSTSRLSQFIKNINKTRYDLCINFSFCKSSSYLSSLIRTKNKMGLERNKQNQIMIPDRWGQYIYTNVVGGSLNPFNIIDIYKKMLGAKKNHIFDFDIQRENQIAIHPFASHSKKSWSQAKWLETIYKTLKDNKSIKLIILGAKSDQHQAQQLVNSHQLSEFKDRIKSEVGENTIEQSFNTVLRSKLFIGHDSMVSHLAAIAQTPSITLALGTVRPHETFPYNESSFVLSPKESCFPCQKAANCADYKCHDNISSRVVSELSLALLNNPQLNIETLSEKISPMLLNNIGVYQVSFDAFGAYLKNPGHIHKKSSDLFRSLYRMVFSYYLSEIELDITPPKIGEAAIAQSLLELDSFEYFKELYMHGIKSCEKILGFLQESNTKDALDYIERVSEIDSLLNKLSLRFQNIKPFNDFFLANRANAKGQSLEQVTQNNMISFYDASKLLDILQDLTERVVDKTIISKANQKNV